MGDRGLILDGSPCDTNFYSSEPKITSKIGEIEPSFCPNLVDCRGGKVNAENGYDCVMIRGVLVARNAMKKRHSVDREMKDFEEFFKSHHPPKGFIYSRDGRIFGTIMSKEEALVKIHEFAKMVFQYPQICWR